MPILYHLTDTRCPSRFFVGDGAYGGPPEWRTKYETMLRENPPDFLRHVLGSRLKSASSGERLGYERHDVNGGGRPYYVVLQRRRE